MRYVPADNDHNGSRLAVVDGTRGQGAVPELRRRGRPARARRRSSTRSRGPRCPGLFEEYLDPDDGAQDDVVGHAFITGAGALLDAVQYGLVGLSIREPGERGSAWPRPCRAPGTTGAPTSISSTGRSRLEETPDGVRVVLEGRAVETIEFRVPPREARRARDAGRRRGRARGGRGRGERVLPLRGRAGRDAHDRDRVRAAARVERRSGHAGAAAAGRRSRTRS